MLNNKKFRCSSLHLIITKPKAKGEILSQTAKSAIRDMVKQDLFGFKGFDGSKYTEKGLLFEDDAIQLSGHKRFKRYEKNRLRVTTDFLTGEADILDIEDRIIIDTKCTWDIGTHPFFDEEAAEKVKKAGYDVQLHGYMAIYDEHLGIKFDHGEVDFCLFPVPEDMLGRYDDRKSLIDAVNAIPLEKRIKTHVVERDEAIIDRILEVVPHAQKYYNDLMEEMMEDG